MSAPNQVGCWRALSPARKFINEMIYFAQQIPSIPVARTMHLASVAAARQRAMPRPSWTALFMRAFGLVAERRPLLRQTYMRWPWAHFYEHPHSVCAVPIERETDGDFILVGTQIRAPERQSLAAINEHLDRYKVTPVSEIGYFRMALRMGRAPWWFRRFIWWTTIHLSGYKRAKRLGTFSLSSYGRLGAEQIHPIGPHTTLLTFGPIGSDGAVVVKIIYDHRVLDGAQVARYLQEIEQSLNGPILGELEAMAAPRDSVCRPDSRAEPLAGPHAAQHVEQPDALRPASRDDPNCRPGAEDRSAARD